MKISWNWLKEYLPTDIEVNEAADILTRIGLEVEDIIKQESIRGGLAGLKVGFVKEVVAHPNADKLRITKVDVGGVTDLQIVCGAPNVAVGQKVIVAIDGTTVHPVTGEPFKIKKSKIRGEVSEGMICAEDEISLSGNHEGIMILQEDAIVGSAVKDLFNLKDDYTLEIGLTPNRSDAFSHIGVARDLRAWLATHKNYLQQLNIPSSIFSDEKNLKPSPIEIIIEDKIACPRYMGMLLTGVTVYESPEWLKLRIESIGLRSINNVVDITNFVLHECGQPLHAFDADCIAGNKVIVKKLSEGTPFITLDEKEIKLSKDDLMICNATEGMCIAGVFGGKKSGVTDATKNIFLESANFHSGTIRKTAVRHNLRTDAAIHFEKGIDISLTEYAIRRAALLIEEFAGAKIEYQIVDVYPSPVTVKKVELNYSRLNELAGYNLNEAQVDKSLSSLGFIQSKKNSAQSTWSVPSHKIDVELFEDVAEEVLRITGFEQIPFPGYIHSSISNRRTEDVQRAQLENISNHLSANGFSEMMNNSIVNTKNISTLFPEQEEQLVRFQNYVNAGLDGLRNSLLLSALEVIRYNQNRKEENLRLFETGKIFSKREGKYVEEFRLAILTSGKSKAEHWKSKPVEADLYELKSFVESVLNLCGAKTISFITPTTDNHQLSTYLDVLVNKKLIGAVGFVNEKLLKQYDLRRNVYYADLDLDAILLISGKKKIQFKELPKFQAVNRDLALVMDEKISFAEVETVCRKTAGKQLEDVQLFDVFRGEKIGAEKKSYAISLTLRDENKTMTDEETEALMNKLIKALETQVNAIIRT